MKKSNILHSILNGYWGIAPHIALNYLPFVQKLLSREKVSAVNPKACDDLYYTISPSGAVVEDSLESSFPGSVLVVNICGVLTKYDQEDMCLEEIAGMQTIGNLLLQAYQNQNIRAIVLNIDSPGGTVDGTEQLAKIIGQRNKPVVAFFSGMCASAAYWIASGCDEIIGESQTCQVGSIGVMLQYQDLQPMYEQLGVKFHTVVADQSTDKNKDFTEMLKDNYEPIKVHSLNPIAQIFIEAVKANRPQVKPEQLTGQIYLAKDVVGSLIDVLGDFRFAIERAMAKSESKTTIIISK